MALCWLDRFEDLTPSKRFSKKNSSKFEYVVHGKWWYFSFLIWTNARNTSISFRTRTVEKQRWKQWGILFWTSSRLNLSGLILWKCNFLSKMHSFGRKFLASSVSKSLDWGCGYREQGGRRWMKSCVTSPSCERVGGGGFHAETAAVQDCSPGRMGSVGGEQAGCQGQALERPAERSCGRSNTEWSLPSWGSREWPQAARDRKEQSSVA